MEEKDIFNKIAMDMIREKRKCMGRTQAQLAENVKIDEKHYGKLENRVKSPGAFTFIKIAIDLEIDINDIIRAFLEATKNE